MTDTFRVGAEDLRAALRAFYVEGVVAGMEAAAEEACCRGGARTIYASRDDQARTAARFFDEEWNERLESGDPWPVLRDLLAAITHTRAPHPTPL
jgi:hypothetical protein